MRMEMRVETGIYGLDELLGSGYRSNTANIVLGSTGTGKTIFALQFILKGLERGEKGIFVSFDMDVKDVVDTADAMGWDDIEDYVNSGMLAIDKFYAENITYINNDLLGFITAEAGETTRIAIDSFTPLISSLSYDMRNDVNWFFSKLREIGTAVITLEEPLNGNMSEPSVVIPLFLGDSVIHLKNNGYGEAFNRTLRIIKHRGSWHAEGVFPYRILEGVGIVVEGWEFVESMREEVNLDQLIREAGLRKEDIDRDLLKKLQRLAESRASGVREVILGILRKYA
ncbi:RAD55 family ATPase [Archaeoglobus veneficus]|uniref:Putative circadian clock protein, KaiC n=1 Tax=Archaeoglobus veneficus (strain DSM 11195 / SNP6) TaxID=693661 RepID=F2KNA9_ARCVS|nr:ATPase domain-containing protein [Archaeoglobus veneficus]AEA46210.1 putative circadian clock protein, KaiC [Archaeoglobus veneficus SNP6]